MASHSEVVAQVVALQADSLRAEVFLPTNLLTHWDCTCAYIIAFDLMKLTAINSPYSSKCPSIYCAFDKNKTVWRGKSK